MNRSESKFNNTAGKMRRALVTLLETKEFGDISIMDICVAAGVNRSTFYAHYDNTYELLREAHAGMVGDFFNECEFDNPVDLSNMSNLSKDDLNLISPKYLLPYLKYIKNHKRLFRIYAENAHSFEVNKADDMLIENIFVPILFKHGVTDKKLIYYMQKFFLKGIDAIINEWVRNDCEDDILFICEIITVCVRPLSYKGE
ncbi:MAG: TetR/AcrR family transcriptional regulator [Clostridiales bacterium]|nr:TetR/AcrR family transcriptional regulator [Clostridiales bacterium]